MKKLKIALGVLIVSLILIYSKKHNELHSETAVLEEFTINGYKYVYLNDIDSEIKAANLKMMRLQEPTESELLEFARSSTLEVLNVYNSNAVLKINKIEKKFNERLGLKYYIIHQEIVSGRLDSSKTLYLKKLIIIHPLTSVMPSLVNGEHFHALYKE